MPFVFPFRRPRRSRGPGPLLALLLLLAVLLPATGAAREAIDEFVSTVTVQRDGSLLVREEYAFTAEGGQIKSGLYRDFPLKYSGPEGYRGLVPFTVRSVTLDGRTLNPKDTKRQGNDIRIFMRNPEPLDKGRHTIVLEYATGLHLRFYDGHAELNWNATGTWALDIKKFRCRIILPKNVAIEKTVAWLGKAGTKNSESVVETKPAPNEVMFRGKDIFDWLEAGVSAGEQLTVAVSFPRDAFPNPIGPLLERQKKEDAEREARWAAERAAREKQRAEEEARQAAERKAVAESGRLNLLLYEYPFLPWQAGVFCMVFGYFFLFWLAVGKDPAKRTVIPRFHPPLAPYMGKGDAPAGFTPAPMSPMAVEYLRDNKRTSGRGLAALFLALAGKRLCSVGRTEGGAYVLRPGDPASSAPAALSPEEKAVREELARAVDQDGELVMRPRQGSIRSMQHAAEGRLEESYGSAWTMNSWISAIGWLLVLPLAYTLCFWNYDLSSYVRSDIDGPALMFAMSFVICFISGLVALVIFTDCFPGLFIKLGLLVFPLAIGAVLFAAGFFSGAQWILPTAMMAVAFVFLPLMKSPSRDARAVLDEIDGLAMYIGAAEQDRLQMLNRPDDTPAVFQALLPYALVLGLEKTWCNRFAGQLAAGLMGDSGVDARMIDADHDWTDFADGFSGAMAASAIAESSSSSSSGSAFGSGGGGGSGSGSGGGGGGGI